MDNKYGKLIAKIKKAQNIAIFMHINPDCDCIGSAISLYKFLQKDGKKQEVVGLKTRVLLNTALQ